MYSPPPSWGDFAQRPTSRSAHRTTTCQNKNLSVKRLHTRVLDPHMRPLWMLLKWDCVSSLEALVVEVWGQGGRQEEVKVADGSLHGDVEGAEQRPPLLQHLLGGRLWEISRKGDIDVHEHWLLSLWL